MAKLLRLLAVCTALVAGQGNSTEPPSLVPDPTEMTPTPTTLLLSATTSVPATTTPPLKPAMTTAPTATEPVATATPRPTTMVPTTLAPKPETTQPDRADTVAPTLEPNTSAPTATIRTSNNTTIPAPPPKPTMSALLRTALPTTATTTLSISDDAASGLSASVLWPLACGIVGCAVAIAFLFSMRRSNREKPASPSPVASPDSSACSFFSSRNGPSDLGITNELLRSTNPIFDLMDSMTTDPVFETLTASAYSLSPSLAGGTSVSTTHSTLLNSSYSEDIYCSVLSDRLLLTGGPSELSEEHETPSQLGDDDHSSLHDDDDDEADEDGRSSTIEVLHSGYGVDMAALQETSSLSPYMDTTRFQAMLDTPVYLGQNDV
ncbi:hypothetical protein SDRG_06388 [Saprolegnia diclina VS20]|uniref:Uncharacterized protein n=1 Tax=Saprolegnia diclina (strain VS20) TaxID=1156394 RepID=T0RUX6_SAPDV|nr:hypothetical protein SDRG_06388 [Saprolegnia diclina VS20]EQC36283.1 hypothetical protein SDRG_06388 [Saprolegnia diclina VS20]|eukprot:XP_008610389.1 hypothetical protein SDRG_06388 [Saprolegnia diclina VS20]